MTAKSPPPAPTTIPLAEITKATLNAVVTQAPTPGSGFALNKPTWAWSYRVEYAATPGAWGPPPTGATCSVSVDLDIYSLGVILYELLTGTTPFHGDDALSVLLKVATTEPPRPRTIDAFIDGDLETICLRCLEKEPGKRYASAEALAEELERWLRGEPILARPAGRVERVWRWCRRNPVVASLTVATIVALVLGTAISTYFAIEVSSRARADADAR